MRFQLFALLLSVLGLVAAVAIPEAGVEDMGSEISDIIPRTCTTRQVKGRVCGDHGEVTTPKFLHLLRPFELFTTFQQCRDLCLGNKRCKSFLFNTPALQCVPYYTYIEPTNHPVYLELAPGRLWDRDCFVCS